MLRTAQLLPLLRAFDTGLRPDPFPDQAADADTARIELEAFKASELGRKNPHTVATFENAWERFTPFLAFPPMLRRVIYTNSIESLNYQLRKIIKTAATSPTTTR